ncbi:MAG TPA: hypothetical protein VFT84_11725 [Gemmatimonadales bacterium]|nr:hypothetical protein [Gemmatimonadales bacterium]
MLTAIVLGATGCTRWQVETRPIPELLADSVAALRVTRADSGRVVLYSPFLVGDSLAGNTFPHSEASVMAPAARSADERRLLVPLREVRKVETRHVATGRTLLLTLGIASAAALALLIAIGVSLQGGLLGN